MPKVYSRRHAKTWLFPSTCQKMFRSTCLKKIASVDMPKGCLCRHAQQACHCRKAVHEVGVKCCTCFPESVWVKSSSNLGVGDTFSHLQIFKCSHLHISSSHLHILSSSHLHISSSHLHILSFDLIFTSTHIIFSPSHLLILTSSHLHICTNHLHTCSCHLHIFTSSQLHTYASSHLRMSLSHLRIFSSSHVRISPSHLLTFTAAHLIFTSLHLHISTSAHVCYVFSLPRLLFIFSRHAGGGANGPSWNATFSHEMRADRQKLG